ncbi:hypothetical protein C5B85_09520 [Pseudoclavibacter sp. AY1F1]|uniref:hypothetical protein n=1 Tax=Pseudoclavibacter sp. AY1F1 TaxID=2080583 RepID=UPI000CE84BC7|nr:hypothetical protein [Pseudoclavibacter sp. AY1F1]PPF44388.1 hypothetical protein C5B85_09520 [Pseudoclavibacter sp. AY1F1]
MTTNKPRPRWLVLALAGAGAIAIALAGVTFAQAMSLRSSPGEAVDLGPIVGAQSPVTTISVTPAPTGPTSTGSPSPSAVPDPVQPALPTGGIQAPVPVDPVGPSQIDDDDDDDDDDGDDED